MTMTARSTAKTTHRKSHTASADTAGLATVIALNLTNMATVMASSATVLLCLLIAKRF
ncbi:hypothetical protein [Rhodopseudomonas telluris]|uniref:Uncharacterized protein n=1 Tax=Rhodopseudomonas telluris TaxID=644215 RepID=A0ABV6ELV6_9BRAD